ncbi:MAG: ABC-type transport auxiliary lipoprotein family protein [Rhodospirillales bacterium]
MTRRLSRRALCGAAASLAGCSVLPERPYQERREWPLEVRRPTTAIAGPNAPVLLLRAVRAGPGLDTRGLRTRQPTGAERIDNWEEWAVPPPQGVEDCLRQWLAACGLFRAVVMPGSQVTTDLVLESELVAFVGDQPAGVARAGLSIVLLRATGNGRYAPLLQRTLTGEARLTGTDGPALAASLQAALATLLAATETALAPWAARPA